MAISTKLGTCEGIGYAITRQPISPILTPKPLGAERVH